MDYAVIARAPEELGVIIVEDGCVTDSLRTTSLVEMKDFIAGRKIIEYALNMSAFDNDHEDVLRMAKDRYTLQDNTLESICEKTGVVGKTKDVIDKCKTINEVYMAMAEPEAPGEEQETSADDFKDDFAEEPPEEKEEEKEPEELNETLEKSNKDWLTTLLLCLFLGGFGAHRFYVGRTKSAILIIVTCFGFCGIWPLVDLIKIALGKFNDAQGLPVLRE